MPYLIDGHNLIGRMPGLRLDDPDDEQRLIGLLKDFLARARKAGTVVFDGGPPAAAGRGRRSGGSGALEVVFATRPRTADDVIRERLRRARNARGLIVVTSDREVMRAARQAGAAVTEAEAFAREVLSRPGRTTPKEAGLSPEEAAAWEEEFKSRRTG